MLSLGGFWAGNVATIASGGGSPPPSYVGPGDLTGYPTVHFWGSPARAYNASYASANGNAMDICTSGGGSLTTITFLSTGFVDTTAINNWVTSNGSNIYVKKLYDQTGNNRHFTQSTNSSMPKLTLSVANGLPGLTFWSTSSAVNYLELTAQTLNQPINFSTVAKRTANNTSLQMIAGVSGSWYFGFANSANTLTIQGSPNSLNQASNTDGNLHAFSAVLNGTSSFISSDGIDTTPPSNNIGGSFSSSTIRIGRSPQADIIVMELGIWGGSAFSTGSGNGTGKNMTLNQRDATYGYNF